MHASDMLNDVIIIFNLRPFSFFFFFFFFLSPPVGFIFLKKRFFQARSTANAAEWVAKINAVAATESSPPLPAAAASHVRWSMQHWLVCTSQLLFHICC